MVLLTTSAISTGEAFCTSASKSVAVQGGVTMLRFHVVLLLVAFQRVPLSTAQDEWFTGFEHYSGGIADIHENGDFYTSCSTNMPVTWTLTTHTNSTLLGTCVERYDRCPTPYPDIRIHRWDERSYIYMSNMGQDRGGWLSCSVTYNNETESDDVFLNVYQPPSIDNCQVHIVATNWSAVLTCNVSQVFSTADAYVFHVQKTYLSEADDTFSSHADYCWQMASGALDYRSTVNRFEMEFLETKHNKTSGKCVFHGHHSYHQSLTSYTDNTTNREYYRGHLVYSWKLLPIPADNMTVQIYSCAGFRSWTCDDLNTAVSKIFSPSTPRHNCTAVTYIPETGGTSCMCTADDLGSPDGRLLWMSGNVTVATGEYGTGQLLLPPGSVSRDQYSGQVVCQLDWIEPQHAVPLLHVAYGPDHVDLHISHQHGANNSVLIIVECQVTGTNPKTPDMVQWEVPCRGQGGFTCVLDPQEEEVQGNTVTCRVTNADNNGHSAGATRVIKTVPEKAADGACDCQKEAVIGAAATLAGAIVIALLVVMVCTCRHRSLCKGPNLGTKPNVQHRQTSMKRWLSTPPKKRPSPPYKKILTTVPVWGVLIMTSVHHYCMLTLIAYVPIYLNTALQYTTQQETREEWRNFFLTVAGMGAVGVSCFLLMASSQLQSWAIQQDSDHDGKGNQNSTVRFSDGMVREMIIVAEGTPSSPSAKQRRLIFMKGVQASPPIKAELLQHDGPVLDDSSSSSASGARNDTDTSDLKTRSTLRPKNDNSVLFHISNHTIGVNGHPEDKTITSDSNGTCATSNHTPPLLQRSATEPCSSTVRDEADVTYINLGFEPESEMTFGTKL